MSTDDDDKMEEAYKQKASFLRSMATKSRNKDEESAEDEDGVYHYGQESEHRKASIPTKVYSPYKMNQPEHVGKTDAENLNDEADDTDNEFKRQMRLKFLNKLKSDN